MGKSTPAPVLKRFFGGLAEYTFHSRLGVADTRLIGYLTDLLVRFIRADMLYQVRNLRGKRLEEVALMLMEAEGRIGEARREVHRHIGDFTLFWVGVYPEAIARLQEPQRMDHLLDYKEQGKRSYYLASTIPAEEKEEENAILARLSDQFELCAYGLNEVRREWERRDDEELRGLILN